MIRGGLRRQYLIWVSENCISNVSGAISLYEYNFSKLWQPNNKCIIRTNFIIGMPDCRWCFKSCEACEGKDQPSLANNRGRQVFMARAIRSRWQKARIISLGTFKTFSITLWAVSFSVKTVSSFQSYSPQMYSQPRPVRCMQKGAEATVFGKVATSHPIHALKTVE